MLNKKLVKEARKLNKPIYVWTVNDMESLKGYYKLNVDGIITDYPEDARETIKMLKEQKRKKVICLIKLLKQQMIYFPSYL